LTARKEMRAAEYAARSTTPTRYDVRYTVRHDQDFGVES
jgi:hypothetical protein